MQSTRVIDWPLLVLGASVAQVNVVMRSFRVFEAGQPLDVFDCEGQARRTIRTPTPHPPPSTHGTTSC